MRIAILSDIHGNTLALEAVLADIAESGGADRYWLLGDYAAIGYDPVGVIRRITALPNASFIRGNTDRSTVEGLLGAVLAEERPAERDLAKLAGFAWTQGAVTAAGFYEWLAGLPLERRETLADGTRVLCVHAAPGRDDGPGIHPGLTDDELAAVLSGCDADLVFVGHTHVALDRAAGGVRVVNLGSVSNPVTADLRAKYVILHANEDAHRIEPRRVDYDRAAAIAATHAAHHPDAADIAAFLGGERQSPWARLVEAEAE